MSSDLRTEVEPAVEAIMASSGHLRKDIKSLTLDWVALQSGSSAANGPYYVIRPKVTVEFHPPQK